MTTPYDALSEDDQVEALRRVALEAAPQFGVRPVGCDLLLHGFNTTFAITGEDGTRIALRVLTNSVSTADHVAAQHAWIRAIARTTSVRVPAPLVSVDGEQLVSVPSDPVGRSVMVTAASWLEGPDLGAFDSESTRALGATMATLHDHARHLDLPVLRHLPAFVEPLFGDEDHLSGGAGLGAGDAAVLTASLERARAAYRAVVEGHDLVPIHGDLHAGNLKWVDGRLAVFDFDDCGLGLPVVDIATTTFYVRDEFPGAEDELRAGYAAVRPLPDVPGEAFESLVASRQLLLTNSLLTTSTAALRAELEAYLPVVVERLRHWLTTGRFTRTLP